ncbi:MAG TPA: hypothetical protein DCG37_02655, partial [Lachnospiraceae bacterium]|nr:hypothetical protein [Lachnospiraceae bacterium]
TETPTEAPEEPTMIPAPVDDSSDESETESLPDDSYDESETEILPDDSYTESESEILPDEDEGTITGEVVGYDIDTVTIKVDPEESDNDGNEVVAEEPVQEMPEGTEDEYPSMTYDEADGEESTYYTFDITNASQSYADGINEGNDVTVSYTGDLDNMDEVQATNVSDSDQGEAASDSVFRGNVESTTGNTVTITTEEGVSMTFSYSDIAGMDLMEGEYVKITADMNSASQDQNIIGAKNIEKL